jgi:hypothetical protein
MLRILTIVFIILLSNGYSKTTQNIELINLKIENYKLTQENSDLKNQIKSHFNTLTEMKNENILFEKLISSDFKNLETTLTQKNNNLNNLIEQYKLNESNFNSTLSLYYYISIIGFVLLVMFGIYKATGIYKLKQEVEVYKNENIDPIMEAIKARQDAVSITQTSIINSLSNIEDYENKIADIYKTTDDDRIRIETDLVAFKSDYENLIKLLILKDIIKNTDISLSEETNENDEQTNGLLE